MEVFFAPLKKPVEEIVEYFSITLSPKLFRLGIILVEMEVDWFTCPIRRIAGLRLHGCAYFLVKTTSTA